MSNGLRAARKERKLTLEGLRWVVRKKTGVDISEPTLSRWERGVVEGDPFAKAAVARALGIPPAELWEEAA
jgi:transcriptional regulator with XRE-family HTH domain